MCDAGVDDAWRGDETSELRATVRVLEAEIAALSATVGALYPELLEIVETRRARAAAEEGARFAARIEAEQREERQRIDVDTARRADEDATIAAALQAEQEHEMRGIAAEMGQREAALRAALQLEADQRTYGCVICLGESTIDEVYIVDECNHRFCRGCILGHIKSSIQSTTNATVTCPGLLGDTPCPATVDILQIQHVLGLEGDGEAGAILEVYDARKFAEVMRADPNYTRCPHMISSGEGAAAVRTPCNGWGMRESETTQNSNCLQCTHRFCSGCHEVAHAGTCAEYAAVVAATGSDGGAAAYYALRDREGYRECPGCGEDVERSSGCSHMTCTCGQDFCYSCGDSLSDDGCGCD
jgi:hypothetical protein